MRIISNNGYYLAITLYICTVAGINGLAIFIHSDCCIMLLYDKILHDINHINIDLERPVVL